jgi:prolyl 4-hydroxylase
MSGAGRNARLFFERNGANSMQTLEKFVRVVDGALPAIFCQQLVANFELAKEEQQLNGRYSKSGFDNSAWTEINLTKLADAGFLGFFLHQVREQLAAYVSTIKLQIPLPDTGKIADLILKRYRAGSGEAFQTHFDSIYDMSNRYLVFLWYLNDVETGGETYFPDLDVRVKAKTGRLLVFPPYWMYQHAGLAPVSNDKYILSTYLLF